MRDFKEVASRCSQSSTSLRVSEYPIYSRIFIISLPSLLEKYQILSRIFKLFTLSFADEDDGPPDLFLLEKGKGMSAKTTPGQDRAGDLQRVRLTS